MVFRSPERRIAHKLNHSFSCMSVKCDIDHQVKYLGLIVDSNLNWKPYLHKLSKKISRGIGVLCKIRYHVNRKILLQSYKLNHLFTPSSPTVYQFGAILIVLLLEILQKRAIHTMTFPEPDEHSEPFLKELMILKLTDLFTLFSALPMYHYHFNLLPSSFEFYFF